MHSWFDLLWNTHFVRSLLYHHFILFLSSIFFFNGNLCYNPWKRQIWGWILNCFALIIFSFGHFTRFLFFFNFTFGCAMYPMTLCKSKLFDHTNIFWGHFPWCETLNSVVRCIQLYFVYGLVLNMHSVALWKKALKYGLNFWSMVSKAVLGYAKANFPKGLSAIGKTCLFWTHNQSSVVTPRCAAFFEIFFDQ